MLNETLERENNPGVIVTLDGSDQRFEYDVLDVTIDSTETEILDSVEGALTEMGESLKTENDYNFAVRKALNSGNVYVYPKAIAG